MSGEIFDCPIWDRLLLASTVEDRDDVEHTVCEALVLVCLPSRAIQFSTTLFT